ncbi:hypothetical protein F5B19DRAFT_147357 [Rostrohypoxylon terebratum]|nr:hypothetical protein F5B19DRAFT_147357 [Rostrohypoxylon terebratum]
MPSAHEAFKALAPVNWDDIAHDRLETFLEEIFNDAQCILDSIPVSSASSTQKVGRPRSATDSNLPSLSSRSSKLSDRASELRKDWKEVKVNPRENPLGLDVYKLAAKDGKGAWFARRSVHDILTFEKWKLGMEKELDESMKVQGKPGDGSIRGIGADQKVENKIVEGRGRMQVYQLSAQFPGPTTPRDFITLLISSDSAIDVPGTPKHYMLVSKPCIHPECPPRQGYIRGQYESVEFIREIRIEKPLRKTRSSIDLPNDEFAASTRITEEDLGRQASIRSARQAESASPLGDGEARRRRGKTIGHANTSDTVDNDEDYDTMVEWLMVTRSDPGGSVPRFMIERGTPPGIAGDANKFVKWISSKSVHDFTEADSGDTKLKQEAEEAEESTSKKRASTHTTQNITRSPSAPLLSAIDEKEEAMEQTNPTGFYGMISNVLNTAASAAASHLPNPFGSVDDDNMGSSDISESPMNDDDVSSTGSFHSLEAGDAEENDGSSSKPEESSTQLTPSVTNGGAESMRSTDSLARSAGASQHDKELKKLEERKRKTEEKLRRAQEKALAKRSSTSETSSQREETALQKLREKHEREVAKQQEKYQKELKRLEAKRENEQKKSEARRKKMLEREEKNNMAMELDKVRAERDLALKKMEILQEQVGQLQAQNTMLVARLGREGISINGEGSAGTRTPPPPPIKRAMTDQMSQKT